MNVTGGDTNVSVYFQMRLTAGGDATGLTITDFDLSYTRDGAATAAKADVTDLTSASAAHTDNGGYEVDPTDCPGLHRFDFPDAAFAAGVRKVYCTIKHASTFTETALVEIDSEVSVTEWNGVKLATTNPLPNAVAGAANGIFIAGTNAATTVTTSFTTTFTGNLTGSVGSLTGHTNQTGDSFAYLGTNLGAIGANATEAGGTGDHLTAINLPNQTMDIIGDITGNLSGSVGSVTTKTGYALASTGADLILKSSTFALAMADAVWDEALAGHVTADTSGLLLNEWQDGGRLDLILDIIAADTTTDIPPLIATAQADLDTITGTDGVTLASGTQTFNMTGSITGNLSGTVGSVTTKTGYSLVSTGLDLVVPTIVSAVPVLGTSSIVALMGWVGNKAINKVDQTATTMTVYNAAGGAIATSTVSDNGTTAIVGAFS